MKITKIAAAIALAGAFTATQATADSYSFAGPYAGVALGMSAMTVHTADFECWWACGSPAHTETDFVFSANGGYNFQLDDNFVIGAELNFSTGSEATGSYTRPWGNNTTATLGGEHNWEAALRVRAGLAVNRTMLFISGGLAMADAEYKFELSDNQGDKASFDGSVSGVTWGAGVEHALSDSMRLKLEYVSTQFENKSSCWADETNGQCYSPADTAESVIWNASSSTFRAGVNWNF